MIPEDKVKAIKEKIEKEFEYDEFSGYHMAPDLLSLFSVMKEMGVWPEDSLSFKRFSPKLEVLRIGCCDKVVFILTNRQFYTLKSFSDLVNKPNERKLNGMLVDNGGTESTATLTVYQDADSFVNELTNEFVRGVGITPLTETPSLYIESKCLNACVLYPIGDEIHGFEFVKTRDLEKHPLPPLK